MPRTTAAHLQVNVGDRFRISGKSFASRKIWQVKKLETYPDGLDHVLVETDDGSAKTVSLAALNMTKLWRRVEEESV